MLSTEVLYDNALYKSTYTYGTDFSICSLAAHWHCPVGSHFSSVSTTTGKEDRSLMAR